jgi:hypothetical protein
MKNLIIRMLSQLDLFLMPIVYLAALLMKNILKVGIKNLPYCKKALLEVGVFHVRP